MARLVELPPRPGLEQYEAVGNLTALVRELRAEAAFLAPRLRGRTVWMVNSTEHGGGVAEMLPAEVTLLRDLGVATEWVVIESADPAFFRVTKCVHNLLHGTEAPRPGEAERRLFERIARDNALSLLGRIGAGDILVVHDPQPMPLAAQLQGMGVEARAIWRCHVGFDRPTEAGRAGWDFLAPYHAAYERAVFSAPEYVPDYFADRALVIHPALDPLSQKNRSLSLHQIVRTLGNGGLARMPGPLLTPDYARRATRLRRDGRFTPANEDGDIGLLVRPIVAQVSRWDRLKGWAPLLEAFARLKSGSAGNLARTDDWHRRRLELVRLVLAGPDPGGVEDDPEGREVLDDLVARYLDLPEVVQRDVALLALPMEDPNQNALMVNALQRAASLVAQNSPREGFGLTVTEAMWKRVAVLSNRRACGPRHQIRHDEDGWLIGDPEDVDELADALDTMLAAPARREEWGRNAQRRVHECFLIFAALRSWLRLLAEVADGTRGRPE